MGKPAVAITLSAEERRLDGLCDEPRPGAPRQIRDEAIAELVRRTLEETPPGSTHWSLRSMARAVGYAPSTVNRIWQAFGLQPHRSETFKLYTDPFFVEKVRDIVGLYQAPTQRAKRGRAGRGGRPRAFRRPARPDDGDTARAIRRPIESHGSQLALHSMVSA
jgi:hypothetical protein